MTRQSLLHERSAGRPLRRGLALPGAATTAVAALVAVSSSAFAQIAVSANDGKVRLVNGVVQTVKDGRDTVTVIDMKANPPRKLAEIAVPASVAGPPTSVAIGPKEDIALVTAAEKVDPADPTKRVPDDKVTVLDISETRTTMLASARRLVTKTETPVPPPKVLATLQAGAGAAGVSFNKAGTLALVANRAEGTVSVFTIAGKAVTAAAKVDLGNPKSGPSAVQFTPDGKSALVTLDGETANKIAVLTIDGAKVEYAKRDMNAGIRPYGLDIARKGDVAVVANIGRGQGDLDTISVIDMAATPPRVVNTVTVGQTPEGIKLSPDGALVAVSVMNGSNKPDTSPFYKAEGQLQVWKRTGTRLEKVGEAPIGKWCQGIVWSANSKSLMVQCMVEEEIQVFSYSGIVGRSLAKTGTIKTTGGPAGIRTAE